MKKLLLAGAIFCSSVLYGANTVDLEVKAGYYLPTSERFRTVYDDGGGMYGGELSWRFWKHLDLFADGMYFRERGKSGGDDHFSTKITIIPVSLGLKLSFPLVCSTEFYVGVAPKYFWMRIDNSYKYVHNVKDSGLGWGAKAGLKWFYYDCLYIDFFVDYMDCELSPSHSKKVKSHRADISGFLFGGGLGIRF